MRFYTNVKRFGNNILVRGYDDGVPFAQKVKFEPTLYVQANDGEWKSFVTNKKVKPMTFESINDSKNFIQKYEDVEGFKIFGNDNYEVQYLSDTWTAEVKYDFSRIRIAYFDAETNTEHGFPDIDTASEVINTITVNHTTFSILNYTDTDRTQIDLRLFDTEEKMLKAFLLWWSTQKFDIITGWNVNGFDMPYLHNRIAKILTEDEWLALLSPWGKVSTRLTHDLYGNDFTEVTITGIAILDYMELYKKFMLTKHESYSLDFICDVELGENKLENPYPTFKEFYEKQVNLFISYNRRDVTLVIDLEKKLKLLELIVSVAYIAKVNYETIFSPVATWEAIIYNKLKSRKIATPLRGGGKKIGKAEGAYVEEPIVGKRYKWVMSIDATSLYPSIMQAWNISPETYLGVRDGVNVEVLMHNLLDTSDIESTIAANGAMYHKDHEGIFGELIGEFMVMRKIAKKNMLSSEQKKEAGDETLNSYISAQNNIQIVVKTLMNSFYGATSNQYFTYFNIETARAITLTGQLIIKTVKRDLDIQLNKLFGTTDYKYVIYLDTDSVYFNLEPYVEQYLKGKSKEQIIEAMSKFCDDAVTPIVDNITSKLQDKLNVYSKNISFKQEVTASSGFWRTKKNYALKVHRSEGIEYKEPKIKIVGMEAVRSSTPKLIRDQLKNIVKIILSHDVEAVRAEVARFKVEYFKMDAYSVAKPTSCNGMHEYNSSSTIYIKGTPAHVKGALLYNYHLKKMNLDKKYPLIKDGEKVRLVYLKMPNALKCEAIAFIDKLPEEFLLEDKIDYNAQFEKSYLSPVISMCEAAGWAYKEYNSLNSFFS